MPLLFYYLDAEHFDSKNFLRTPAWQKAVSCQRVKYDMKCFKKLWLFKKVWQCAK